jgi:hypothetical protein
MLDDEDWGWGNFVTTVYFDAGLTSVFSYLLKPSLH